MTLPLRAFHSCRIYTDGLTKDSKQSFISWLVAITTLTLYTGAREGSFCPSTTTMRQPSTGFLSS